MLAGFRHHLVGFHCDIADLGRGPEPVVADGADGLDIV